MFGPLAWTKTFILIATLIIVITLIPAFAHWIFSGRIRGIRWRQFGNGVMIAGGLIVAVFWLGWAGLVLMGLGVSNLAAIQYEEYKPWSAMVENEIGRASCRERVGRASVRRVEWEVATVDTGGARV